MKLYRCLAVVMCCCAIPASADQAKHRKFSGVPFTEVKFQDAFWTPRLETNREKSLPHNFQWCEQTGRIDNFAKAGKLMEGKFRGIYFNDSDVYKVLEGAAYSLAIHPYPKLEKTVNDVISKIAAAQQPDGYLNTYFTLAEPRKRWTDLQIKHELYCAGHLFEAAVAHYRATGKRTLLDVATKFADCIDGIFGPGRRPGLCGHEEIELALVKLYQATDQEKYLKLAEFFLDMRGNKAARNGKTWGMQYQDHAPVREQTEVVGHAVRAMYLWSGVADAASYTGEQKLIDAMDRVWRNMVQRNMYVTGGIGAQRKTEAFGKPYELPNESYCETCAAIGVALWAHRMNLMYGEAQYADVLERCIYNGILSGIGMEGKSFFYVNPLVSKGNHHRQPFFDCACCPSNVVRFLPSLPGYQYAADKDGVFVNLYIAGKAKIALSDHAVGMTQETQYPWDGKVKLTLEVEKPAEFTLGLRIPGWCKDAKLTVKGLAVPSPDMDKGYAVVRRTWQSGDVIELDLPMPVERIEANPKVEADRGRVAIQRGPIVYCFEAVDNGGKVSDIVLPADPKFTAEHRNDLLGGVTVVTGVAKEGRKITAVPYYAWDHRAPGEMAVWVQQDGKSTVPPTDDPAWKDILYRPMEK
jgi:uncharacterized protein